MNVYYNPNAIFKVLNIPSIYRIDSNYIIYLPYNQLTPSISMLKKPTFKMSLICDFAFLGLFGYLCRHKKQILSYWELSIMILSSIYAIGIIMFDYMAINSFCKLFQWQKKTKFEPLQFIELLQKEIQLQQIKFAQNHPKVYEIISIIYSIIAILSSIFLSLITSSQICTKYQLTFYFALYSSLNLNLNHHGNMLYFLKSKKINSGLICKVSSIPLLLALYTALINRTDFNPFLLISLMFIPQMTSYKLPCILQPTRSILLNVLEYQTVSHIFNQYSFKDYKIIFFFGTGLLFLRQICNLLVACYIAYDKNDRFTIYNCEKYMQLTQSYIQYLKSQIAYLSLQNYQKVNLQVLDKECTICLSKMAPDESDNLFEALKLDCGHYFHEDCIKSWFARSNLVCPVCRASIRSGRGSDDKKQY